MSHLSAGACTQRLAAGRGDEYPTAAAAIARYRTVEHWTDLLCVVRVVLSMNSRPACEKQLSCRRTNRAKLGRRDINKGGR